MITLYFVLHYVYNKLVGNVVFALLMIVIDTSHIPVDYYQ